MPRLWAQRSNDQSGSFYSLKHCRGEERESTAESARFLYFAKGSSGELITQIYIAIEIGVIDKQNGMTLIKEAKEISAMIASLIKIRKGSVREESTDYKST